MREKAAGLKKQMNLIDDVMNKMNEQYQKLLDAGYLQDDDPGMLRTDLTAADRLVADPMMATYEK